MSSRPVVAKDGKFGTYVTDGEVNASLGRGDRVEDMLPERAFELLALRRETMAEKGTGPKTKRGAGPVKKAAAKKPAKKPVKKPAGKITVAKKATAKKSAVKKVAAKKKAAPKKQAPQDPGSTGETPTS